MSSRKIVKGDIVMVISGDDKGKTGKVLQVITEDKRILALVEGVNLATVHIKPKGDQPGGKKKVAKPVDISNLSLMEAGKVARVGFQIVEQDGQKKKVRVFKKTNKRVDE